MNTISRGIAIGAIAAASVVGGISLASVSGAQSNPTTTTAASDSTGTTQAAPGQATPDQQAPQGQTQQGQDQGQGQANQGKDCPDGGHHRGPNLDVAAKAIGISADDLRTELQSGKTMAEVAKAHDVDPQKVIDALVADVKAHLDEQVKSGDLTQAQADQRLAEKKTEITDHVNNGKPDRPQRPDGEASGSDQTPGN